MTARRRSGRFDADEAKWMRRALALAERGRGDTSPNPMVGAVLAAAGRPIAEGHHEAFGGAHAEVRLLEALGRRKVPADAVLYLTLEPCAHYGKTPPCVDALLASPIRRFVIAAGDPDRRARGRGIRALRRSGREVRVGLLGEEARLLNAPFYRSLEQGRAFVTLKLASTLDGKLADEGWGSRWITGREARAAVARMRSGCDAVVVGSGTVARDDPRLTARSPAERSPSRIVIDGRLRIDPDCRAVRLWRREASLRGTIERTEGNHAWIEQDGRRRWIRRSRMIVATADPSARRLRVFERSGWEIWNLPDRKGRNVSLPAVARRAAAEGLHDLLVEAGPGLAGALLRCGPVDRLLLFLAPKILGGRRGWSAGIDPRPISRPIRSSLVRSVRRLGDDLLLDLTGPKGSVLIDVPRIGRFRLQSSRG